MNQRFANSLNPFGYIPNKIDTNAPKNLNDAIDFVPKNIKNLYDRFEEYNNDMNDPKRNIIYNVSPATKLDLNKKTNKNRYDALQMYVGNLQSTFYPSKD